MIYLRLSLLLNDMVAARHLFDKDMHGLLDKYNHPDLDIENLCALCSHIIYSLHVYDVISSFVVFFFLFAFVNYTMNLNSLASSHIS